MFLLDAGLVVLSGFILGALFTEITLEKSLVANVMTGLAVALTGMIAGLRPFGTNETRPRFWRESSAGINRFAYFCSVNVGQLPCILLLPVFFLSFYYLLTSPRAPLGSYFVVYMFTYWAATGIGYVLSTVLHPDNSKMAAVVITLISAAVCGTATTTICKLQSYTFVGPFIYSIAYSKWFSEALFEIEANEHSPILRYNVEFLAGLNDYSLDNFGFCLTALFIIGGVTRVLAFILLVFRHRGKQK